MEEAKAYFNDLISAQEAAEIIQIAAEFYISEQK